MYYCDKKLGAIDPITGAEDVVSGILNIFGQSKAADAAAKQQAAQIKLQKEILAANQNIANQEAQTSVSNTTLYIVGGILVVAVLGIAMSMRSPK